MKKSLVAVALVAPAILGVTTVLHALLPASPKASAATAVPIHRQTTSRPPLQLSSLERGILPITRTATPSTTRRVFKPAPDAEDQNPLASVTDDMPYGRDHRINEVSIIVSPSNNSPDMTYCAYMRYPHSDNTIINDIAFTDMVTSRPVTGDQWIPNQLDPPLRDNGVAYDNTGDPVLAANLSSDSTSNFHPSRVYLAATSWTAGTSSTGVIPKHIDPDVHQQNQITVWSHDPGNADLHWVINHPIDPNTALDPNSEVGFDPDTETAVVFDDKPAIAVSQFAGTSTTPGTRGNVYVAYVSVTGLLQTIRFARCHPDPNNNNQDIWDEISTVYDPNLIPGNPDPSQPRILYCPRIDIAPGGQILLSWLEETDNKTAPQTFSDQKVSVMMSSGESDQGVQWSAPSHNPTGQFVKVIGRDAKLGTGVFLSTSYNTTSKTLALVYGQPKLSDVVAVDVVMRSFDPANSGFSTPMVVSDSSTNANDHTQWGGVVACDSAGGCLVSYYDHWAGDEGQNGLFTYRVEVRRLQYDGQPFPGDPGPIIIDDTQSDASKFRKNFLEYQDVYYRGGTWYTASVVTAGIGQYASDALVKTISCPSLVPPRVRVVRRLDNNSQLYPKGWSGDLTVDLDTGDIPSVTWTEENSHSIVTTRPEHGSTITVQPAETTTYTAVVTDLCGDLVTSFLTITICPTIAVAPASASAAIPTVGEGSVSAHVEANGAPVYTWYDGDTNAPIPPGDALTVSDDIATGDTITFHSTTSGTRHVWAKVDSCGASANTGTVTLGLVSCVLPQVSMIGSGSILAGQFTTLTVYLDPPSPTATYQWYRGSDHAPMPSIEPSFEATTDTYDTFYCVVTVHCTSSDPGTPITSPNAYLSVYGLCEVPPIGILQSTADVPMDSPDGVSFTAILDWGDVTFQWYRGQSGDTSSPVNADNGALNRITVGRYNDGPAAYWVRGFLSCGATRDSDTVTFTKAGCSAILFDPQPQSAVIKAGEFAALSVKTPLVQLPDSSYRWWTVTKLAAGPDTETDTGSTGESLNANPQKTTLYRVIATGCTTAKSAIATVRVGSCDSISTIQWPQDSWIDSGQTATLSVTAAPLGGGTLTYKWFAGEVGNESAPLSETSATLQQVLTSSAAYWVRLKDQDANGVVVCYADSPTIHVNVCLRATRTGSADPIEKQIMRSQTTRLYYDSFIGTALTYQWYQGSPSNTATPLFGNANAIVVRPEVTATYWVRATSHCGNDDPLHPSTDDSPAIRISVCPSIVQQPVGAADTVMPGQTTTLTAEDDLQPNSYQWYVGVTGDTSHPFGAHALTVTTPPITADTQFWLQATNGSCSTNSDPVTVHVCTPLPVAWATIPRPLSPAEQFTISIAGVPDGSDIFWYQGMSGDQSNPTGSPANLSYSQIGPLSQTTSFWARVQKGSCWTDLPTLTLPVCVPVISLQPAGTMINAGASWQMTVAAAPTGVTYQWYTGNSGDTSHPIAGETTSSYTVHPAVTTSYWVRVDGGCGVTTDSSAATVSICQAPAIQSNTTSLSIVGGQPATCLVNATGTNLTYQWYIGTTGVTTLPITGATSSVLTATPQDNINYWVRVTGTCGAADSDTIPVSVCASPAITSQPQNSFVFSGATATLSVAASESTSNVVTYQWYLGNTGDTSAPVIGAILTSFTTPPLTAQTSYWARASCNVCTPADSQAATVSICPIPSILLSPGTVNVAVGQSGHLSTITGTGNTYQWYSGASGNTSAGVPSTSSTLDIAPSVTTTYWCRVTNGTCVTDTPVGTVNVCIPTFTQSPQSIMINPGASTTLTSAANTPGVTYQWYTGNSSDTSHPIAGATAPSYLAQPAIATTYWVRATGGCGIADSSAATVSICQVPVIQSNTPSLSIVRGQNATCLVNATGTNLTYQWYIGTTGVTTLPITGATSSVLTTTPQDNINYWVHVTGTCGAANSVTIPVSVCASPAITSQPQNVYVFSGAAATLSVAASESTSNAVTYQWYRGNTGDTSTPLGTGTPYTTAALTTQTNYWARASCNVCTPADSQTATVSICPIPATLSSPGNANVAVGQSAQLSTITGTGNTYAWYVGPSGNTSVGAPSTSSTLNITPSVTTTYWCRVTNGTCVTDTPVGTVNVCIPTFTQQPQSITITAGSPTTLTSAANTAGVTYQWYVGAAGNTASPVSGGTTANLTITPSSTTSYWVRATGSCGVTTNSTAATVTLCQPPVLTNPPHDSSGVWGSGTAYFSITATGSNITYQWYIGDSGTTTLPVSGATSNTLALPISSTTKVWVRVSGQCGVVNSATVWASVYPTAQPIPSSLTVGDNSTASITVTASGAYLHYVWKWGNGTVITGAADSATLITPSIASDSTVYCEVWSGAVETSTNATTLTVCYGQPYIYSLTKATSGSCRVVTISTTAAYDYEWYQGVRGDVSHPAGSGYASIYVCPTVSTQYWCRVFQTAPDGTAGCSIDSSAITVP
jgi:hypothetical protein